MRAAIIGTGGIAHTHAQSLVSLGHELALVVGHSLPSAQAFGAAYGCSRCTDTLTVKALEGVDAVHICAPPSLHGSMVRLCLEAGKHILCEKPLALDPEEAFALEALAREKGVIAAVDFNNRFYDACGELRHQAAALGPVSLIHGHYQQEFHILPAPWSWRYQDELRAVSEIGSHFFDLMGYLTGLKVESVSALFQTARPERRVREGIMYPDGEGKSVTVTNEDAAVVTCRMAGGALASVFLSEVSPGRGNDLTIELISPQGSVSWCSEVPYEIVTGQKGQGLTHRRSPFGGGFTDTFRSCFGAFYQSVESDTLDPRLATFHDGAVNARLCRCIAQSARSGGAFVPVPDR